MATIETTTTEFSTTTTEKSTLANSDPDWELPETTSGTTMGTTTTEFSTTSTRRTTKQPRAQATSTKTTTTTTTTTSIKEPEDSMLNKFQELLSSTAAFFGNFFG